MSNQVIAALVPEARAAQLLSFDETKAQLNELAKQSERITQITNKAGRDECHSSLMVLKGRRVDIEKRGKEARDDANKFAKAVIAKERELIGFIEPEEIRLQLLRDQWDNAREMERLAKLEAERLRVEAIQAKIQSIRDVPGSLVGKPSIIIAGQLAKLRADELSEDEFAEQFVIAREAHTTAIVRVEQLLAAQQEADAEKKRQAERDAEMEAMRVKMAEQQRLIDEAEEAKRVEQDRIRAEQEAALQAERERQAAEQKKLDEQAAQLKRDQQVAAEKAEADRLANLGLREAAEAVVSARSNGGNVDAAIDDLAAALSNDIAETRLVRAAKAAK